MKIKKRDNSLLRYACLFIGLLFIGHEIDNDGWFLLNHGRYVLEYGIPYVEPFTIHENFSFVMQQCLSSLIFWEIYKYFGIDGLIIFLYPMGALTIYAIYRLTLMSAKGNKDVALVISSFIGIIICLFFIRTRPQIFSTLIFVVEIICLESLHRTNNKKYLLLFPFLSLALINMHAAMWPMMIVFLIPFFFEHLVRYDTKNFFAKEKTIKLSYLCIITVLTMLAGFVNPYGGDAMTYVFRSYGYDMISNLVNEMQPITIRSILGKFCEMLFFMVIFIYARHKVAVRYILLTLGTMVMAMSSLRSLYLFLAVGLYPLAYVYREWQGLSNTHAPTAKAIRLRKVLILMTNGVFLWGIVNQQKIILTGIESLGWVAALIMLTVFCLISFEWKYGKLRDVKDKFLRCGYISVVLLVCFSLMMVIGNKFAGINHLPNSAKAVEYILAHESVDNVRLWTNYNEGAYAEFMGIRCFIDPRAEVFLSSNNKQRDVFYEYASLEKGSTDYRTFLSWYDFNYILVSDNDIMYTYLPSDDKYVLLLNYKTEDGMNFCLYHIKDK